MFTVKDLAQLKNKGISAELVEWQLSQFSKGVKPINLVAPATIGKGIMVVENRTRYIDLANNSKKLRLLKFVPASGAASRMFKDLFEYQEKQKSDQDAKTEMPKSVTEFFEHIHRFAFYSALNQKCANSGGVDSLIKSHEYGKILDALLEKDGLAYGELPKGLLLFHKADNNRVCTPFEEHLTEGALYAKSENNQVKIHFTVSPEHQHAFTKLKDSILPWYENKYKVHFDISFSVQKPSTDTIAVTTDNTPFYKSDGTILFRPGGHGALIENLNEMDADIIFIKNIDNVVPESKVSVTVEYKKLLAGILIESREKVFSVLKELKQNTNNKAGHADALKLISDVFQVKLNIDFNELSPDEIAKILIDRLDRPIRVCGVVKNQGEPGGGPFIVLNENSVEYIQIVESSQVDSANATQQKILQSSTHFNPVDLVCSVTDINGKKYNLKQFVDNDTCFISKKSKSGRDLKALELPGLWNGAMAGWNTILVEVPVETFNPVKTVNDLLRPAHQNEF